MVAARLSVFPSDQIKWSTPEPEQFSLGNTIPTESKSIAYSLQSLHISRKHWSVNLRP